MFNGTVRELVDVRYVPEIKSNLISLGGLESCRYKYTCQGGALTLSKGSLAKVDNLYKPEGNTEVSYEVTDLSSCLWQKNQGHKSEKELQVLLVNVKSFPHLKSLFLNSCLFYIFASYDGGIKGCVWDPISHKVIIDRDI
jgi:hypothetical protein